MHPDAGATVGDDKAPPLAPLLPWFSTLLAFAIAAFDLARGRLPPWLTGSLDLVSHPVMDGLRILNSGLVGDYVMWIMVGLALFTIAFGLA